jgi:hypothetical protein
MYYRGSNAAVIVYDITNEASFADVKTWIEGEPGPYLPRSCPSLTHSGRQSCARTSRMISSFTSLARSWIWRRRIDKSCEQHPAPHEH